MPLNQRLRIGVLVLSLIVGCGGGSTGTVSGKVLSAGKPLSTGTVTFYAERGGGFMAGIRSDGGYEAVALPVGSARIAVQLPAQLTLQRRPEKNGGKQAAGFEKEIKETQEHSTTLIPAEYMDSRKSGLSMTVERERQTHDTLILSKR
jgi:hypothetical protein